MLLSLSSYDTNTINKLTNKTKENFLKNLCLDFLKNCKLRNLIDLILKGNNYD
ncbi:conserved hypothetical protein (plasmid) [Borreliella bissettiae DN127]|uniref:Uncharacterized protein n=1 Tax=Borrelia bissettiae (strain DSM 17990 / CIP 109136 / DN127) TaxID=521010 RepID=G0AP55_BORBD|nr:conserved hypothetical protein [Borreliella bissettiae DN127]